MTVEYLQQKSTEYMFVYDQDLVQLQDGFRDEFQRVWRQGFHFYVAGNWTAAIEYFQRCSMMRSSGVDGPAESLIK